MKRIIVLMAFSIILIFSACSAQQTDEQYVEQSSNDTTAEISASYFEASDQENAEDSDTTTTTKTESKEIANGNGDIYSNEYISFTVPESMKEEFVVEKSGMWINIYESGTHKIDDGGRVVAVAVVDTDYEDILGWSREICRITKGTEEKIVIAEWPGDDQRAGYYDEELGYCVMYEDLAKQYEDAKTDVVVVFDSIVGINGWKRVSITHSDSSAPEYTQENNYTPYSLWEMLVTNSWTDEDGNRLKFTQNITYYKLKPNATHTDYDYYMGTLSTTDSKGYYYGHYHIDDDKKMRIEFNDWPDGSFGILLNEWYVWDPTLREKNSWCVSSDGKIMFSQGDNELSGKTYSR